MLFDSSKVAFGRHETFALRYGWLTKGFQAVQKDSNVFTSPHNTVTLGVGKNMVHAIRYWLLAAQLIKPSVDSGYIPSDIGLYIFGQNGFDPYLEDEATIWLVHWLIASNPKWATGWYWFFNRFHKPQFNSQEVATALLDFTSQHVQQHFSETTIAQEASIILRMYARHSGDKLTVAEDMLDSPLSLLGLITQIPKQKNYLSQAQEHRALPAEIVGFAAAQMFKVMSTTSIPIENLMYAKDNLVALGAVFRLTENALITKLEKLVHTMPNVFEMRETAGIHQLYLLDEIEPINLLRQHYQRSQQEIAA